jgi:hypothetical protein
MVQYWLRKDPTRWFAGVLGGAFAGLVAMAVAMAIASSAGFEFWYPVKLFSTPFLGGAGTDNTSMTGAWIGIAMWEALAVFWGFVYSHFVYTNSFRSLLPMGLVWGLFLWIFNWNLYLQSFKPIRWAAIPSSTAILLCVLYGVSLASVGIFDRMMRPQSR